MFLVPDVRLYCYLVLLPIDSKTRYQDSRTLFSWFMLSTNKISKLSINCPLWFVRGTTSGLVCYQTIRIHWILQNGLKHLIIKMFLSNHFNKLLCRFEMCDVMKYFTKWCLCDLSYLQTDHHFTQGGNIKTDMICRPSVNGITPEYRSNSQHIRPCRLAYPAAGCAIYGHPHQSRDVSQHIDRF